MENIQVSFCIFLNHCIYFCFYWTCWACPFLFLLFRLGGIDGIAVFVLQVFDFILEEEEMKTITALNRGWRYIIPTITVSLHLIFTWSSLDSSREVFRVFKETCPSFALRQNKWGLSQSQRWRVKNIWFVWWRIILNSSNHFAGGRTKCSQRCRTSPLSI